MRMQEQGHKIRSKRRSKLRRTSRWIKGLIRELDPTPVPKKRVFFVEPRDGDKVPLEFWVVFGVQGLVIVPSGVQGRDRAQLHLLIDQPPIEAGLPIEPAPNRVALGEGRTSMLLMLEQGLHALVVQASDPDGRALDLFDRAIIEVASYD